MNRQLEEPLSSQGMAPPEQMPGPNDGPNRWDPTAFDFTAAKNNFVDFVRDGVIYDDPNTNAEEYYYDYTPEGQYVRMRLQKYGEKEEKVNEKEVKNEHKKKTISFCSTASFLEFGNYFAGVFWRPVTERDIPPAVFYASNFRPYHRPIWYALNGLSLAVAIVLPALFIVIIKCKRIQFPPSPKRTGISGYFSKDTPADVIPENIKAQKKMWIIVLRRMASYGLLIVLLILQAGVAYGITYLQAFLVRNYGGAGQGTEVQLFVSLGSVAIGLILTVTNVLYGQFASALNKFEKYATFRYYGLAYSIKFLLFRVSQLVIINIAKSQTIDGVCPLYVFGTQYFSIMMTDLIVGNGLQIVIPIVSYFVKRRFSSSHDSNEDLKPEFVIAEEYISLIYRQFIVYNAMVSFPLAPFVAFLAGMIEYNIDKLKVTTLTQKSDYLVLTSFNTQITITLTMTALACVSILNIGGGPVYLMIGEYFFCQNYVPVGGNATISYCKTLCPIFYGVLNQTLVGNSSLPLRWD